MIHLIKLSTLLSRPVQRVPGTRGGSMISEVHLDAFINAESQRSPSAVQRWVNVQTERMRRLLRHPKLRTFAVRMLAILKEARSIATAWADVDEALASEAAGSCRLEERAATGVSW